MTGTPPAARRSRGLALIAAALALLSRVPVHSSYVPHLPAALTGGYRLAFGAGAGLALAAIVLAAAIIRPRAASGPDSLRPGAGRGMVAGPQGSRPCPGS